MNNLIKTIEIFNFRSINHAKISCSSYNLFCGRNDVGKSNVLKALNLFFNQQTDFGLPFDFSKDYNKTELARAQTSKKKKQQIRIRIYLNVPSSYRSLARKNVYVEKVYDRYDKRGIGSTIYSETSKIGKTSISRLLNKIQYIYLPALKGDNVIQYLLDLLGSSSILGSKYLDAGNEQIQKVTNDMGTLLQQSQIAFGASIRMHRLVDDFWRQMLVATDFEQIHQIETLLSSTTGNQTILNKNHFFIPINSRGDGMKSRFIPPLLQWLQKHDSNQVFIWGIDEPENSLEFKAADELSALYTDVYAKSTQIFATSHSMAFIHPRKDAVVKPLTYRVIRDELGCTKYYDINKEKNHGLTMELLEEIGALELQNEIIDEFRAKEEAKEKELHQLNEIHTTLQQKMDAIQKPLIITEGKTDWKHIKHALIKLKERGEFEDIDVEFDEYDEDRGCDKLQKIVEGLSMIPLRHKIIAIYDTDKKKAQLEDGATYKKKCENLYELPIPNPQNYSCGISIEMMYPESDIKRVDINGRRLYLTSEFDSQTTILQDGTFRKICINKTLVDATNHNLIKIVDNKVLDVETGFDYALSKEAYARYILNEDSLYADVDVSGFRELFESIRSIINE